VAGDAVGRDRAESARRVAGDAIDAAVAASQREQAMIERDIGPAIQRMTLLAGQWEAAGQMSRRLLIVGLVARVAIGRNRIVNTRSVTLLASKTAMPAYEGEEIVIEAGVDPLDGVVTFLARRREVA